MADRKGVLIQNINQGGIAESLFSGASNSVYKACGLDIHSVPGLIKVNQKMSSLDDIGFCLANAVGSNGTRYWFNETGEIYSELNDVFTKEGEITYTDESTDKKILSACEYNGYVYFTTQDHLHRFVIPAAGADISDFDFAWAVLEHNDTFHGLSNNYNQDILYIANCSKISGVNGSYPSTEHSFVDEELAWHESNVEITAIGSDQYYVLFGFSSGNRSQLAIWNAWSNGLSYMDEIFEDKINSFLKFDNYVLVNAGGSGGLYVKNGTQLEMIKRLPISEFSTSKKMFVHENASAIFKGSIPLFGVSNLIGNSIEQGIWSYGQHSKKYPMVFNLEYPISKTVTATGEPVLDNIEIGSIMVDGANIYMSWKRTVGEVVETSIDKINYSLKQPYAYFETRAIMPDLFYESCFNNFKILYQLLPTGSSVELLHKNNFGTSWLTDLLLKNNDETHLLFSDNDRQDAMALQLKCVLKSSANLSPELVSLSLMYE